MVTFYANPDDQNEIWIEKAAFEGTSFRIWHYIFFCVSAFTIMGKLFQKNINSNKTCWGLLKKYVFTAFYKYQTVETFFQ